MFYIQTNDKRPPNPAKQISILQNGKNVAFPVNSGDWNIIIAGSLRTRREEKMCKDMRS